MATKLRFTGMRGWTITFRAANSGTHGVIVVRATHIEGALERFYETFVRGVAIVIVKITDGSTEDAES